MSRVADKNADGRTSNHWGSGCIVRIIVRIIIRDDHPHLGYWPAIVRISIRFCWVILWGVGRLVNLPHQFPV